MGKELTDTQRAVMANLRDSFKQMGDPRANDRDALIKYLEKVKPNLFPKKMEKGGEAKLKLPESKRINLPTVPLTKAQKEALKNRPKPKGMPVPSSKLSKDYKLPESMIQNFKDGGMVDSSCRGGGAALRGTKFRGVK